MLRQATVHHGSPSVLTKWAVPAGFCAARLPIGRVAFKNHSFDSR